jgi:hypothetical protein
MYSEIMDAFSDQDGSLARQAESTEELAVAQKTALKAEKSQASMGFFIYLILPAALWHKVRLSTGDISWGVKAADA